MALFQDSLVIFLRATELESNDHEYIDIVGNAYSKLGKHDEARYALNQAMAADKNYAFAHYDSGTLFVRIEVQQLQALESCKQAISCNPELEHAYYGIACIYALWANKRLALKYVNGSGRRTASSQNQLSIAKSEGVEC